MAALLLAIALIVYGSLFPWHFSAAHANPWWVLMNSWPQEWNHFTTGDAYGNIAGYVPLGVLAFLAAVRRRSPQAAAAEAILIGLVLSVSMELLQVYVPGRVSSLFDVACNATGAAVGALAVWHFRKPGSHFRRDAVAPVLLLVCWTGLHFYPFIPWISFDRVRLELLYLFHPRGVSPIQVWSLTAEWLAVGVAIQRLFGRVRLRWLLLALAFHFAVRPIMVSIPFSLEDALGALLALLLWKPLPEPVRSSPWLLVSVVLLRECVRWPGAALGGSPWMPFQALLKSNRGAAIISLFRTTFDYAAIIWMAACKWPGGETGSRPVSYAKAGVILAGALAALAVAQRYLPGGTLSMTDPALALLLGLALQFSASEKY